MAESTRGRLSAAFFVGLGAIVGLVLAVIAILNLHIIIGLEQGYAATPAEVADFSIVLVIVDVIALVAGPVLGALAVVWGRRRMSTPDLLVH